MHFREYQLKAGETDQSPAQDERGILIPLLGLAGEVGTLLAEYKKHLRDGDAHRLYHEQVAEDLGDHALHELLSKRRQSRPRPQRNVDRMTSFVDGPLGMNDPRARTVRALAPGVRSLTSPAAGLR